MLYDPSKEPGFKQRRRLIKDLDQVLNLVNRGHCKGSMRMRSHDDCRVFYCMVGAVIKATGTHRRAAVYDALFEVLPPEFKKVKLSATSERQRRAVKRMILIHFNDVPGNTRADVINLIQRARGLADGNLAPVAASGKELEVLMLG